jgi:hypothetical protein
VGDENRAHRRQESQEIQVTDRGPRETREGGRQGNQGGAMQLPGRTLRTARHRHVNREYLVGAVESPIECIWKQ